MRKEACTSLLWRASLLSLVTGIDMLSRWNIMNINNRCTADDNNYSNAVYALHKTHWTQSIFVAGKHDWIQSLWNWLQFVNTATHNSHTVYILIVILHTVFVGIFAIISTLMHVITPKAIQYYYIIFVITQYYILYTTTQHTRVFSSAQA